MPPGCLSPTGCPRTRISAVVDCWPGCVQPGFSGSRPLRSLSSPTNWSVFRCGLHPNTRLIGTKRNFFVKQLQGLRHRAAFEISGNQKALSITFLVHQTDAPILRAAFKGRIRHQRTLCLRPSQNDKKTCPTSGFRDFYPHPPYSHLLTSPQELKKIPASSPDRGSGRYRATSPWCLPNRFPGGSAQPQLA